MENFKNEIDSADLNFFTTTLNEANLITKQRIHSTTKQGYKGTQFRLNKLSKHKFVAMLTNGLINYYPSQ